MFTVMFSNRGVAYTVHFNIHQLSFNQGVGSVSTNAILTNQSLYEQHQPWQVWLRFSSKILRGGPAWGFEAPLPSGTVYRASPGIPLSALGHQQIGFIQIVEYLEWRVQYQGIVHPFIAIVQNATDRSPLAIGRADHPWYNVAGEGGGPLQLVPASGVPPVIDDSPEISLRSLGHLSRPENPLRSVTASGRFLIWLVVKHEDDPGDRVSSLQFLYHFEVRFARSWIYNNTGDPDRPQEASFLSSGGQNISTQGTGRGPSTPVFSDRVAHEHINKELARWYYPR